MYVLLLFIVRKNIEFEIIVIREMQQCRLSKLLFAADNRKQDSKQNVVLYSFIYVILLPVSGAGLSDEHRGI